MQILMAISKILDIKAVQWALLAVVVALLAGTGVQSFRLWSRGLELRSAKAEVADTRAFLAAQNTAVMDWKAKGDEAARRAMEKTSEARAIAADYEKRILNLKNQPIRDDCCGAIEDAKFIVLTGAEDLP